MALAGLLGQIARGAARIPRAIDGAMWEKNRTVEELDDLPEDPAGAAYDPQTGKIIRVRETVDRTRPSRIAQGLGEVIRAGIVAAGSPTPGHVGTAQDIFGGMKAVEQDRQVRQDRATQQQQRRTAEQMAARKMAREERESESGIALNDARISQEEAQSEMYQAQAEKARQRTPDFVDFYKRMKASNPEFSEEAIISAWIKQPYGSWDNVTTEEGVMKMNKATGKTERVGSRPMPFTRGTLYKGAPGTKAQWLFSPMMRGDGTIAGTAQTIDAGVNVPPRQQPFTRPRITLDTDEEGNRRRTNLDTGESTPLGYKARPTGKPSAAKPSPIKREVAKSKEGGAKPTRKATPEMLRAFASEMKVDLATARKMFQDEGYEVQ